MAGGQTYVQIRNELQSEPLYDGWRLCLHRCRYVHPDRDEHGFRFIWRRPDGSLQAARGQARIPDLKLASALIERAVAEGWGELVEETPDDKIEIAASIARLRAIPELHD